MEHQLLAASLASRESYELIKEYISFKGRTYSKPFQVVMNKLGDYYARDPEAPRADKELLLAQIAETIRNDKHIATFNNLLSDALAVDLSDANVKAMVLMAKQQEVGDKLSAALVEDASQATVDKLLTELQELRAVTSIDELAGQEEAARVLSGAELKLNDLLTKENDPSNLIKLYPSSLNERVDGGVKRGHHIIIYARPNAGKTATCIHLSCGFLHQGFKVLYVINEDREEDVYLRHVYNLSGYDKYAIGANAESAQSRAATRGIDRLVIAGLAPGSIKQIADLIEEHEPDVVIVDQLRNLNVRADGRVNQLDAAARGVRDLGKFYNVLMVSVTQAGDSAEGKAVLDMGDVDFSNCLAEGQLVKMYDGSIRRVETLTIGEQVMGMDSTPRTVTKVGSGEDELFLVEQSDGKSYEVNSKHILTVKKTTKFDWIAEKGEIIDLPLEYLQKNPSALGHVKGMSVGVDYPEKTQLLPAYFLGLWLADGGKDRPQIVTKDETLKDWCLHFAEVSGMTVNLRKREYDQCYYITFRDSSVNGQNKLNVLLKRLGVWNNKHIPELYLLGSRQQRLNLLAGIIDGDGYLCDRENNPYYEIAAHKFQQDILDLCWSLGFKASMVGENRIYVSGNIADIPCKLERKKAKVNGKKDVLCSKLKFTSLGRGKYYGITVDGDQRYLLANYIVTHNTGIPAACDVLLAIGKDATLEAEQRRMISLPKNKLGREEHFVVNIQPNLSRLSNV